MQAAIRVVTKIDESYTGRAPERMPPPRHIMRHLVWIFAAILTFATVDAVDPSFLLSSACKEPTLIIHNRILAKINGKAISTLDLTKKMDLAFFKEFPQYSSSVEARSQFYLAHWKLFLEEIIDKELILADAKESEITVSQGDVRQEIEAIFGPNVVSNLDKAGFSWDEAAKAVEEDMLIKRMIAGRAHAKAVREVTPFKVQEAYQQYLQDPSNAPVTRWTYRTLTFKERSLEKGGFAAQRAHQLLSEGMDLKHLKDQLKNEGVLSKHGSLAISEPLTHHEKELSPIYHEVLAPLQTHEFSAPFLAKSRETRAKVYRILFVEQRIPPEIPSFEQMEESLKNRLIDRAIDREADAYMQRLHTHYHVAPKDFEQLLPKGYVPCSLR